MNDYFDEEAEIKAQVKRLAARLKEEREKARISQMDLSLMAGCLKTWYSRLKPANGFPICIPF
jgi:hypothetical protein